MWAKVLRVSDLLEDMFGSYLLILCGSSDCGARTYSRFSKSEAKKDYVMILCVCINVGFLVRVSLVQFL